MRKRWTLVALAGMVVLAAAVTLSLRDPEQRQVVTAASQDAGGVGVTTTIPDLPIEGPLHQHLTCQGEMMMGTSYDSLAGVGYATPEEALQVVLAQTFPQAPRTFALTGRTAFRARFENDRGAFLVAFLEDGLWHMGESAVCASTGEEWTRGSASDPR